MTKIDCNELVYALLNQCARIGVKRGEFDEERSYDNEFLRDKINQNIDNIRSLKYDKLSHNFFITLLRAIGNGIIGNLDNEIFNKLGQFYGMRDKTASPFDKHYYIYLISTDEFNNMISNSIKLDMMISRGVEKLNPKIYLCTPMNEYLELYNYNSAVTVSNSYIVGSDILNNLNIGFVIGENSICRDGNVIKGISFYGIPNIVTMSKCNEQQTENTAKEIQYK